MASTYKIEESEAYKVATTSVEGFDFNQTSNTPACFYLQGEESIFVTHFRLFLVATWEKAINITHKINMIRKAAGYSDPDEGCKTLAAFRVQLSYLLYFVDSLCSAVIRAEQDNTAPQDWHVLEPPFRQLWKRISIYIDIRQSPITFPFQAIDATNRLVDPFIHAPLMQTVALQYNVELLDLVQLPTGGWRAQVGLVDAYVMKVRGLEMVAGESKDAGKPGEGVKGFLQTIRSWMW